MPGEEKPARTNTACIRGVEVHHRPKIAGATIWPLESDCGSVNVYLLSKVVGLNVFVQGEDTGLVGLHLSAHQAIRVGNALRRMGRRLADILRENNNNETEGEQ